MKKISCTLFSLKAWACAALGVFLFIAGTTEASAQTATQLNCIGAFNVTVGDACEAEITPELVLDVNQPDGFDIANFIVQVEDQGNGIIMNNGTSTIIITSDSPLFGTTVFVTAIDTTSGNSCWGNVLIEDKLPPTITVSDVTVTCGEPTYPSYGSGTSCDTTLFPTVIENCGEIDYDPALSEVVTSTGLCQPLYQYLPSDKGGSEGFLTYSDEEFDDPDCGESGFLGYIVRTWTAIDDYGNVGTHTQRIYIEAIALSTLACPEDITLTCGVDDQDTDITGEPTINGGEEIGDDCKIISTFEDTRFDLCGNGYKLIRTWTVYDWCTGADTSCNQFLTIEGTGPELICPEDKEDFTDPWECTSLQLLEKPEIVSGGECDVAVADLSAWVESPDGEELTVSSIGDEYYATLPLGTSVVTWIAEDDCGHTSTCSQLVEIIDNTPPVAICDEFTVVSLTSDGDLDEGLTKVYAETFDDGSYDNCYDIELSVQRKASCIDFEWTTEGCGEDSTPDATPASVESRDQGLTEQECVPFACCDVDPGGTADPILVKMWVTEIRDDGRTELRNSCWVEVEVQDKLEPLMIPPPDVYVSCDYWFEVAPGFYEDPADDPLTSVFGDVLDAAHYDNSDREEIIISDLDNTCNTPQPYTWGLDGFADDNCELDIDVTVVASEDCGGLGFHPDCSEYRIVRIITRLWTATDPSGNTESNQQQILVVDFDPFYISDTDCTNSDANDGVIWPCDVDVDDCTEEIAVTYPTIFDDNCSLIGVTHDDTRFDFVDGACYKILREWTIIDWCQYDPNTGGHGLWSYTQVIKVIDTNAPTFSDHGDLYLCVEDENVALPPSNRVFTGEDGSTCSAHVWESYTVSEFCSDDVEYDVKLYPFDAEPFVQLVPNTKVAVDTNGQAVLSYDTRQIAGWEDGLPYNDAENCGDKHRLLWTVEDGCGNVASIEYYLRLDDCKAPSPVCVGVFSAVMPSTGSVRIWAKDFDASSFDDCTDAEDLLFSFSEDAYVPYMDFDCDFIDSTGGQGFVQIWVADDATDCEGASVDGWSEHNKDFCEPFVVIQSNDDSTCPTDSTGSGAAGLVQTEELETVEMVEVQVMDETNAIVKSMTTGKNGEFFFANGLLPGGEYEIHAERNDDHKNGVSTLDLVHIQKHLLGIEDLASPYKLIAADANNSGSVSALDLLALRKLILGLYNELPSNQSWRFVDANYTFADPTQPWDFDETVNVTGSVTSYDFVGVKVGDVDGNVTANANGVTTRNVAGVLNFNTAEQAVVAGETVTVDVTAENFQNIIGYQFTLRTEGLTLTDVAAGAIDMTTNENIAVHKGAVAASWNRVEGLSVDADANLFTLTFIATQAGNLSDMLNMNSRLTTAEAYDASEQILDVTLNFTSETVGTDADFALFQNTPNPFNGRTVVGFTLPEAAKATFSVFDITGKVVHVVEGDYAAGYNEIALSSDDLSATGVLYYRLDADDFTATKKMVLID